MELEFIASSSTIEKDERLRSISVAFQYALTNALKIFVATKLQF